MVWVILWCSLALGAVLVGFLVGRSLFRSARATFAEVERATERLAAVADRAEMLQREAEPFAVRPGLAHEPVAARSDVIALRKERAHRAARRRKAHSATYDRWRAHSR